MLLTPVLSLAWGPETHIKIALNILETTNFSLLKNYPAFFITGNLFPDFFNLFKDISKFKKNLPTHSWNTVSLLFKKANSDADKAFAHGYASHLAADIIAHNHLVPEHTMLNNKSRFLSHFMVEMASASNDKKFKYILLEILEHADVRGELFLRSFNIEKLYFKRELFFLKNGIKMQSILKLSELATYLKNRKSPTFIAKCDLYEAKSTEMARKAVENGFAQLMKFDPSGKRNINKAKILRKKLLVNFSKKELKEHSKTIVISEKMKKSEL